MPGITSGVGLISGIDYQTLIDQLIATESGSRDQLLKRVSNIDAQRTAYLSISARITALLSRIERLGQATLFQAATATSSNTNILNATAGAGVQPGSYQFVVRALAATHQLVSRGFAQRTTPLTAGTLTIESARARVDNATSLEALNGNAGVRRGSFEITNKAGQKAVISIADAVDLQDVLDKINAAGIQVTASVRGDGLVLTDASGGSGLLRVRDLDGGQAAADLGFATGYNQAAGTELVGQAIVFLAAGTRVASLNDGLGVRSAKAGGDFYIEAGGKNITVDLSDTLAPSTRFGRLNHGQGVRLGKIRLTSRDGTQTTVDLSGTEDINQVKEALEGAFGGGRISVVLTGSRLIVSDKTDVSKLEPGQRSNFIIEDLTGNAALDLGINGSSAEGKINGRDILLMDTVADVINAVNFAVNNVGEDKQPIVTASIAPDGRSLQLQTAFGKMVVKSLAGSSTTSQALADLGLKEGTYYDLGGGAVAQGSRIVGGLNSVLLKTLNGGAGLSGQTLRIEANGLIADIDVTGATTLADVINRINQAAVGGQTLGVEALYDGTGTRVVVQNVAGTGTVRISGDFAEALGLAQTGTTIKGANLQRRYVSETTALTELSAGRGVARGKFKITAANGAYGVVDLTSTAIKTLKDVIDAINELNIGVQASINATGDGLLLTDTTSGAGTLSVEEQGGTTARDLNLLRTAVNGQIDGSFEFKLTVGGNDTLEGLAKRIGAETTLATAALLNDGTAFAPYRLNVSAAMGGRRGALVLDEGTTGLGLATLSRAQDARVYFGSGAGGLLLTSSSNTFENVVPGLSFTVSAVSDDPVTVKVERDLKNLGTALQGLVDDFNSAMSQIREAGKYDADTETPGILQGEGTLRAVEQRLFRMFTTVLQVSGGITRLSDLGIKSETGNKLSFDENKFRQTFEANPEAVQQFFATADTGAAATLKKQIEQITGTEGLIPKRNEALAERKDLLQKRIELLNDRLERRRAQLSRQFQAMETALAQLQSQQSTLTNLAQVAQNFYSTKTSAT